MKNQSKQIDGNWYAFRSNGRMLTSDYGGASINGSYYRAKDDNGHLYVEEWIQIDDTWYYYGAEGKAPIGLTTIGGKTYYFGSYGRMLTNTTATADGTTYLIDDKGIATAVSGTGWIQSGDYWYYAEDGSLVKNQSKQIGGNWYAFLSNGRMLTSDYGSASIGGNYYRAKDSSGHLYVTEWVQIDGTWYYYGAEGKAASGITTFNGKTYYFGSYGRMQTDTYAVADSMLYRIGSDGVAHEAASEAVTIGTGTRTVNLSGGEWAIFRFTPSASGLYVFFSDGSYDTYGQLYNASWGTLTYDDDGGNGRNFLLSYSLAADNTYYFIARLYGSSSRTASFSVSLEKIDGSGWQPVGSNWMYILDGSPVKSEVKKIDGKYYGFTYGGFMYDDTTFGLDDNYYRAKAGGALYVNEWFDNYWYGADGKAYSDTFATVNGKQYYFNPYGEALSNAYFLYDGEVYYADASCSLSKVTTEGLYSCYGGTVAYVSGSKAVTEKWQKAGDSWYYFDSDGQAVRGVYEIEGSNYFFGEDCIMRSGGWLEGGVYYANASGVLATGEQKINNKWYYFNAHGVLMIGAVNFESHNYISASDGVYQKTVSDGWSKYDGSWYYVKNGSPLKGTMTEIDGAYYRFDSSTGAMLTNATYNYYVFGSDGKRIESGWTQLNGAWYYVDPSTHKYIYGQAKTIDGKDYYFEYDGRMAVTDSVRDGYLYTYGSNGVQTSKTALNKNGWTLGGGSYYYYKDGSAYTGWVDGKYYIYNGVMLRNSSTPDYYWVGNDGKYISTQGWISEGYIYVKSGGQLAHDEWEEIDGSWYYFNGIYACDGAVLFGSELRIFDRNGKWIETKKSFPSDGWVQASNGYYLYMSGGYPVHEYSVSYGGAEYYMDDWGFMVTGELEYVYSYSGEGRFYFGADGKKANYTGWQQIGSRWYYFNPDHSVYSGWLNYAGSTYYLSPSMATGYRVISISTGVYGLFYFDSNGHLQSRVVQQNGWYQAGSNWYYFVNGSVVYSGLKTIDGVTYGFSGGRLASDRTVSSNGYTYYADAKGVIVTNTWKKIDGTWYYFGADGKQYYGVRDMGSNGIYYFPGSIYYY